MFERVPARVVYDTEQENHEEWLWREALQSVGEHLLRRVKRCVFNQLSFDDRNGYCI